MNNQGFTLLEMLVVLIIISLIFTITAFNYLPVYTNVGLTSEVKTLKSALEVLKLDALISNQDSELQLTNTAFTCYLGKTQIYQHEFFQPLTVTSNFPNNAITINDDGRVSRGGRINLATAQAKKSLIINISMGRSKIE